MTLLLYPVLFARHQGSCFHQAPRWELVHDLSSQAYRQMKAACGFAPADTPAPSRREKKGEWWCSLQGEPLKSSMVV